MPAFMHSRHHRRHVISGKDPVCIFFRQPEFFANGFLHKMVKRHRIIHVNHRHQVADAKSVFIFQNSVRPSDLHIFFAIFHCLWNIGAIHQHSFKLLPVCRAFAAVMKYFCHAARVGFYQINFASRAAFINQFAQTDFFKMPVSINCIINHFSHSFTHIKVLSSELSWRARAVLSVFSKARLALRRLVC